MNRRDCLRLLLASSIAEAVDVERLLWVPRPMITVPTRTVFLPRGESFTVNLAPWAPSDVARVFGIPVHLIIMDLNGNRARLQA